LATPAANALGLVLTEMGLVLTVAGLLAGLACYGTERLLGTLEVYLARPTSGEGFFLARYLGLLAIFGLAVVAALAAADAAMAVRYGELLPTGVFAVALGACLATLAAWLAVAFALAHLLRGPLRLTAAVLAILVTFCFLWTPALVAASQDATSLAGVGTGSSLNFDGSVLNPAASPATLGVLAMTGTGEATLLGVVLIALLWVGLPLVAAFRAMAKGT
jgi:ABC-type transport system involved in multi-copper enzyme maturation permease subunit